MGSDNRHRRTLELAAERDVQRAAYPQPGKATRVEQLQYPAEGGATVADPGSTGLAEDGHASRVVAPSDAVIMAFAHIRVTTAAAKAVVSTTCMRAEDTIRGAGRRTIEGAQRPERERISLMHRGALRQLTEFEAMSRSWLTQSDATPDEIAEMARRASDTIHAAQTLAVHAIEQVVRTNVVGATRSERTLGAQRSQRSEDLPFLAELERAWGCTFGDVDVGAARESPVGKPVPHLAGAERALGRSFAHVEAYTGMGDELGRVGAKALTVGHRVEFADDEPSPALVAHELTHVAQNDQAGAALAMAAGLVAPRDSEAEAEAEANGAHVAELGFGARLPPVIARPAAHIHLAPDPQRADAARAQSNEHGARGPAARSPSPHHHLAVDGPQVDEPVLCDARPGFIDHSDGANLRTRPAELAGSQTVMNTPLAPATRVFVSGRHPLTAEWWYVTAFPPGAIVRGYVQGFRVTTELPEPMAKLHQVKSGDTVEHLAVQEFTSEVRDGHDLRYYENVLLYVNRQQGRIGIIGSFQEPGLLSGGANNVQLVAGHRIWLVSPAYSAALEHVVPAGSLTGGAMAKAKRLVQHLEDLVKSVTESPSHLGEIAGEYGQAIHDHMPEIIGIMAGFIMAEAASAFLAATPTGVGQIAAVAIQLGLTAFGAAGLAEAGVQALEHAERWLTIAWRAKGNAEKITASSKEFLRLLVSLAMAALSYAGAKGSMGKATEIASSMPTQLPSFAVVGNSTAGVGAGTAAATGVPGPAGALGVAMAMSSQKVGEDMPSATESSHDPGGSNQAPRKRTQGEIPHADATNPQKDSMLAADRSVGEQAVLGRPFRVANEAHPPNAAATEAMSSMLIDATTDCSEIAHRLYDASGTGRIIRADPAIPGTLRLIELGKIEEDMFYHEAYTDGAYVFDPRMSSSPIPKSDWMRTIITLNPGVRIR